MLPRLLTLRCPGANSFLFGEGDRKGVLCKFRLFDLGLRVVPFSDWVCPLDAVDLGYSRCVSSDSVQTKIRKTFQNEKTEAISVAELTIM